MGHWEAIAEGRWRWNGGKVRPEPARSDLPMPGVISDTMPLTEQVNGKFYDSKSRFRAVGRSLGLTEVGSEKPGPRTHPWRNDPVLKRRRRETIGRTIAEWKMGRRPKEGQ